MNKSIEELLGKEAGDLLNHQCHTIQKDHLLLPGPDFVDRVVSSSDRPAAVMRNMQTLFNSGRLAGTGYLSILPVDQGIEHSAGASFAPNPIYFDPENIVKLAIEGGCNGVASTGNDDLAQAIRTAVINKRAGGMGLISGRKSFQKPMKDGIELLNAIQDVYLNQDITIA